MNKKLVFCNEFHKGDLHYTREFVKDIAKKFDVERYEYAYRYEEELFKDLKNMTKVDVSKYPSLRNQSFLETENEFLVNTWIGQNNAIYVNNIGCHLYSNYTMMQNLYKQLNLQIEDIEYYIPKIDFNFVEKDNINNFIEKYKSYKKVIISNGDTLSGQALNFDFNQIVNYLSTMYKDTIFILTDSKNRIEKDNIFYTSDIIQLQYDLNEISYLSTFCDIIIGRASGPYCFCQIADNLLDKNKTIIAFSNTRQEGLWYNSNISNQIWSNVYDPSHILNTILVEINKIKK